MGSGAVTPPKRTWRREGGWEEPLRFGRLALVALRSPGKVLVSTAPGDKFQSAQSGTAGQHSSWGDIGKHEQQSTWTGDARAGPGAQLPHWGGGPAAPSPTAPGVTPSLPLCQVQGASWEGPASDFGKVPLALAGSRDDAPLAQGRGQQRGTHGLGHCQSPARCWTLPPDGFPRDPRGPLEEKPPLSPPLPPIRPMGPLGPLGPPGPPGPPGPVGRSPVSAGSHGKDGKQLWGGRTVPPRRGGGIPRCSRGGIPPLRLFIGPFFRARVTFSLLPWKSFPGRHTMAAASVNHSPASHTWNFWNSIPKRRPALTIKPFHGCFGSGWVIVGHGGIALGLARFLVDVEVYHGLPRPLVHLRDSGMSPGSCVPTAQRGFTVLPSSRGSFQRPQDRRKRPQAYCG